MSAYTELPSKYVRALSSSVRLQILAALKGRAMSVGQLSAEVGVNRRSIAYHVRRLAALGFVTAGSRRAEDEPVYTVSAMPAFSDAAWGDLPSYVREAMTAAALAQIHATAVAAAARGGFDRSDIHLTRTPLSLDEEGFVELAAEKRRWIDRVDEIAAAAEARLAETHEEPLRATSVMMLFETPIGQLGMSAWDHEDPEEPSQEEEDARTRAFFLHEQLEAELPKALPDLTRVFSLVNELRLVTRALMVAHDSRAAREQV